jgi:glycosyltransferase involved in cell wall biosynthesis
MARLSICIPTYNRSRCLAELLDSIVQQGASEAGVEVVVSDDASSDDTAAVVRGFVAKLPNLRLIEQPANIGLDRNFLAVVEAASGDYVWLMGDDDRLEPGAIARVLAALDAWPGLVGMTVGVIDYDSTFTRRTAIRPMPPTTVVTGVQELFGKLAGSLGYMSAMVVNRAMWRRVCRDDDPLRFANYYIHVYIVGRMIGESGAWGILHEPCVGYRTGNDQFLTRLGWSRRMEVDAVAYEEIAGAFFPGSRRARIAMRNGILKAHILARIRNAKTARGRTPELLRALRILLARYWDLPLFWSVALPTLFMPKWLLRTARSTYQRYARSSGAWRARRLGA